MRISGRVLDNKTETPLQSASITVLVNEKPSSTGTITNSKGEFTLDSPLLNNLYNKVLISYIGYESVTLSATSANTDIYIVRKGEELEPVVIIGKRRLKLDIITIIIFAVITTLLIKYISKIKQIQNL